MPELKHRGRSEISTLFTRPGGHYLIYSADRAWMKVKLRLDTAGPVAVSTRKDLQPVFSGKGVLLYGFDRDFILPKGSSLYYAAQAVNRVSVVIEPLPWLEQILHTAEAGFKAVRETLIAISRTGGTAR